MHQTSSSGDDEDPDPPVTRSRASNKGDNPTAPCPPTKDTGRASRFASHVVNKAKEPVPDDMVAAIARNYKKATYSNVMLMNHRGVGCTVDKDDFMSIEDDQWITDGVIDFHNVLLSIRKPTLRNGKTWAAMDCKAYTQTNSQGAPLTLGNGRLLLEHDYLAIPVLESEHYSLVIAINPSVLTKSPKSKGKERLTLVLMDSAIKHRNSRKILAGTMLVLSELAKASSPSANMEFVDQTLKEADCCTLRVVSAATQLLLQGGHPGTGTNAEAGGNKTAPRTPQRPSARKMRADSSPEEDGVRNGTRVALASTFAACAPASSLLPNPLLSQGAIPHWMFTRGRQLLGNGVPPGDAAWGDTHGQETLKGEEEEDLVSDSDDDGEDEDTCATTYTGVKLDKRTGKFGVKILIKERGKHLDGFRGYEGRRPLTSCLATAGIPAFVIPVDDAARSAVEREAWGDHDGTGAESADSSERSEEEDEESEDTSAPGSQEESADQGAGGKTHDDGCAGISAANADRRTHQDARDTDVSRGDGRGQADGLVGRTRVNTLDANGDDVRIPSRILEQLIQAQDKSAKENARLEALFLNAMSRPSGGSGDGYRFALISCFVYTVCAQRVCELARVHMFLNRPTSTMTFYPSSDDKTHGVCAVLDRLPHSFACLALAADKSRRADLNKTLSEWKTRAAARVRDIALPKLGLFRDDRDASSPWAPEKARSIDKIRERIGLGADPPETLVLTSWANDRDGMPFASRAFATCAKAAFRPKKAGLVMTLKVYHLAWLEHVVSDCVLYWEERKGRLSNSAGGNAHVVDGLKVLVKEVVERAIRIRNPEYDAEREAWIWGRHGLRISACGLEHMKPTAAAQSEEPEGDDDLSASVGDE
ncbi:unnamed protein product [Closterium sp. Yama58-4]|nr:unnamed protein product [Closterium sp. Yama58-4]